MSAELVLAIVGIADGCIKLANKALSMCRDYRHAEEDLDKKLTILEAVWVKLETQLKFLRRISEKGHLNNELAQCHFTLLEKLHGVLLQADSQMKIAASSIESNPKTLKFLKLGKWKYALLKKTLDTLMVELEAWQGRFDPSWYLIILISGSVLDSMLVDSREDRTPESDAGVSPLDNMLALRRAIDADSDSAVRHPTRLEFDAHRLGDVQETITMNYTTAKVVIRTEPSERLIIEPFDLTTIVNPQAIDGVENLARRLQCIDPDTFRLLRCEGILRRTDPGDGRLTALEVVYRTPSTTQLPTTLRQLLLNRTEVSLSARVNLAKQLVRSVSYIHACDFVHKNIRPENIVLFPSSDCPIGSAYLLGLTQFRSLAQQTNLLGDFAWHRNLYRHPTRQGICILNEYVMQHDIYSLGVCLLEIGLWKPLVWYPQIGADEVGRAGAVADVGAGRGAGGRGDAAPVPGLALALRSALTDKVFNRAHVGEGTDWVKEDLLAMATTLLPARMGEMYTSIVESCLTCLDDGSEDFGGLGKEKRVDDVTVGVRFVEKILARVGEIRV